VIRRSPPNDSNCCANYVNTALWFCGVNTARESRYVVCAIWHSNLKLGEKRGVREEIKKVLSIDLNLNKSDYVDFIDSIYDSNNRKTFIRKYTK